MTGYPEWWPKDPRNKPPGKRTQQASAGRGYLISTHTIKGSKPYTLTQIRRQQHLHKHTNRKKSQEKKMAKDR